MSAIDLAAFEASPLNRDPFDYVIVPGFIRSEAVAAIAADFPRIDKPGSFPIGALRFGPAFAALLDEFSGPEVRRAFERKFGVDLSERPLMVTVRGRSRQKDGRIHTDTKTKIITVLIYFASADRGEHAKLRLLRSPDDLEDFVAEVPPDSGLALAFRRSDNSYHGHRPFVGERRVIQFNWVRNEDVVRREQARHLLSARLKRLLPVV
jgi:hypothetical protein